MKNLEQSGLVALDAAELQEVQGGTPAGDIAKAIVEAIEAAIISVIFWPF